MKIFKILNQMWKYIFSQMIKKTFKKKNKIKN